MKSTMRKGFTLIELLIVVVIIGILAAIAIPKFATTKQKAYMATMKTDLRNLVTAQEAYFSDNQAFTNDTTALNFSASKNVSVTIDQISASGWHAKSVHALVTGHQCDIYVGPAATAASQKDGAPVCT